MKIIAVLSAMVVITTVASLTYTMHFYKDKDGVQYEAKERARRALEVTQRAQNRQQRLRDEEAYRVIQNAKKHHIPANVSPLVSLCYRQEAAEHNRRLQQKR